MAETAVKPERILSDLQQLWVQLAQDQAESGGVLRACAMTLMVVAESDADADDVRQTVGVLMHAHPSRAIVIRAGQPSRERASGRADVRRVLEAVRQGAADLFGRNRDYAGSRRDARMARFMVPLRVPDLPVVLWCRGAVDENYMYRRRYSPLFTLADKIVFDTRR